MAYKELAKAWIGQDPELIEQIAGACLSCAVDIANEDDKAELHAERLVWANKVKANPHVMAREFLVDVCENATIAANIKSANDSDIKYVVSSALNKKVK